MSNYQPESERPPSAGSCSASPSTGLTTEEEQKQDERDSVKFPQNLRSGSQARSDANIDDSADETASNSRRIPRSGQSSQLEFGLLSNTTFVSIFILIMVMTDMWQGIHYLFPTFLPSPGETLSDSVNSVNEMSDTMLPIYIPSQHHDLEEFLEFSPLQVARLKSFYAELESEEAFQNSGNIDRVNSSDIEDIFMSLGYDFKKLSKDVREAFDHAWTGYKTKAWGMDSLRPVSGTGVNDMGGLAITMIDSIDTLILFNYTDDIEAIRTFLVTQFRLEKQENINVFETNIRVLGGLLSAHALTEKADYLVLAEYVASKLLIAFVEPTGIPYGTVGFKKTSGVYNPKWTKGCSSIAEVGTLSLEYYYLARLTGKKLFSDVVDKINKVLYNFVFNRMDIQFRRDGDDLLLRNGLFPSYLNPVSSSFAQCTINQKYGVGGGTDSVYEYFLKLYILTGKQNSKLLKLYIKFVDGVTRYLVRSTNGPDKYVYVGEQPFKKDGTSLNPLSLNTNAPFKKQMDHLSCFLPGTLAYGVYHNVTNLEQSKLHMRLARQLMRTCYSMYAYTTTKIAPEIARFDEESEELGHRKDSQHALLRPETVESLYLMYAVTNDPIYKVWAANIFKALQKYARVKHGYSGIKNVDLDLNSEQLKYDDFMPSFFLSETLKYLALMFDDELSIPLDKYVYNTEAHPFPIFHATP